MSADEGFFTRWSRRKRGKARRTRELPKPAVADRGPEPGASAAVPAVEAVVPADPQPLPPIESIAAGSDVRGFLAAGVPIDLVRAALRRAWSVDPAIRDFVGLSENSWDFTAPGGVPGFGSLTEDEARSLLGRLVGGPEPADPAPADTASSDPLAAVAACGPAMPVSPAMPSGSEQDRRGAPPARANAALQQEAGTARQHPPPQRRSHGGALPK